MRTAELQSRLKALGFDAGPSDGVYGPTTENAIFACLDEYTPEIELPPATEGVIPAEWLPDCGMERIILHWSAGAWKASAEDRSHYHILIEDDGGLVRGDHAISDNVNTSDDDYAAHTKGINTGSIGVAVCAMANAVENPFDAGPYPLTESQWDMLSTVVAQLCSEYDIPVSRETVLMHGEVQDTLGIAQSGKWDIGRLPFDPSVSGADAVGDKLRAEVNEKIGVT